MNNYKTNEQLPSPTPDQVENQPKEPSRQRCFDHKPLQTERYYEKYKTATPEVTKDPADSLRLRIENNKSSLADHQQLIDKLTSLQTIKNVSPEHHLQNENNQAEITNRVEQLRTGNVENLQSELETKSNCSRQEREQVENEINYHNLVLEQTNVAVETDYQLTTETELQTINQSLKESQSKLITRQQAISQIQQQLKSLPSYKFASKRKLREEIRLQDRCSTQDELRIEEIKQYKAEVEEIATNEVATIVEAEVFEDSVGRINLYHPKGSEVQNAIAAVKNTIYRPDDINERLRMKKATQVATENLSRAQADLAYRYEQINQAENKLGGVAKFRLKARSRIRRMIKSKTQDLSSARLRVRTATEDFNRLKSASVAGAHESTRTRVRVASEQLSKARAELDKQRECENRDRSTLDELPRFRFRARRNLRQVIRIEGLLLRQTAQRVQTANEELKSAEARARLDIAAKDRLEYHRAVGILREALKSKCQTLTDTINQDLVSLASKDERNSNPDDLVVAV